MTSAMRKCRADSLTPPGYRQTRRMHATPLYLSRETIIVSSPGEVFSSTEDLLTHRLVLMLMEPWRGGPTVAVGETHGKGYHKSVRTLAGSTNLTMGDSFRVLCLQHYLFHGLAPVATIGARRTGRSEDNGAPYDVEVSASVLDLPLATLEFLPEGVRVPLGVEPTCILRPGGLRYSTMPGYAWSPCAEHLLSRSGFLRILAFSSRLPVGSRSPSRGL
jgi:hypothetical protein